MRIMYKNIFDNAENIVASTTDQFYPVENMFTRQSAELGRFDNKQEGYVKLEGVGIANSVAIFNTNAKRVVLKIEYLEGYNVSKFSQNKYFDSKHRDFVTFDLYPTEKINVYNFQEISYSKIEVYFFGDSENLDNLGCGFLMIGRALDFPPHNPAKTHSVNFTREQFFSTSGQYFKRYIPHKKFDTWGVEFPFLTNEQKNLMLSFFEENNFDAFVLQVWKQGNITPSVVSLFELATYNVSKYFSPVKRSGGVVKPVHEMKSGLYVVTNEALDFKKSENKIYPWSTDLSFREVK